jgi:hypothetical protein
MMTAKILRSEIHLHKLQVFKYNVKVESLHRNISICVPFHSNCIFLDRWEYLENIRNRLISIVTTRCRKRIQMCKATHGLISLGRNYLNRRLEMVGLLAVPQNRELQNLFCKVAAHLISMLQLRARRHQTVFITANLSTYLCGLP